ncbi:hypothetical protein CJ030_MR2G004718 [Morella rubra]|uniref:Myb/SANT-like domain-containing protein n=1 Tax=Morella rubra TaxID=262757 RepID=A0A6A1WEJ1_9ROSI|nr:hypothetical protein CJ030_MR2G004718 [Morella rubra]
MPHPPPALPGLARQRLPHPPSTTAPLTRARSKLPKDGKTSQREAKADEDKVSHHDLIYHETGFGWDPMTNTVTASAAQWQAYIDTHPDPSSFRTKGLANYDLLSQLFQHNMNMTKGVYHHSSKATPPNTDDERELEEEMLGTGNAIMEDWLSTQKQNLVASAPTSAFNAGFLDDPYSHCVNILKDMQRESEEHVFLKGCKELQNEYDQRAFLLMTKNQRRTWWDLL